MVVSHEEKISSILKQIKKLDNNKEIIKIIKNSVSHVVPNPNAKDKKNVKIDLSSLNEIIEIDAYKKTCTAESGVTFEKLVTETLKYGLIPLTVPELKGITIGGAVSGCSVESMSYRYGGFHDSSLEYELITGDGRVIRCSEENNSDIFHMIHGSYGTLGYITKIKFKLIPAKPYVRLEYKKFTNLSGFWRSLKEHMDAGKHDFIDAIIHSKNLFVICLGTMVDEAPDVSNYFIDVFYKSTKKREKDFLNTFDYFFRYDADCHWLTRTLPLMEAKFARLLFGKILLGSTNLIKWSGRLKTFLKLKKRPEVVVDVFIPSKRFEDFYRWYERDFDFFPLWIVPYRLPNKYPWLNKSLVEKVDDLLFIDCAVYGKKNSSPNIDYSEVLEKKVYELNGIKTLISRNHYDRETFWNIYNKENYNNVKEKTDPKKVFPDLYDKFVSKA